MPPLTSVALQQLEQQQLTRHRQAIESRQQNKVTIDGRRLLNFASNDYLGLAQHKAVTDCFAKAAKYYGLGSSSSALICGHHKIQQQLEQQFSEFIGAERSLYFNSGYHANLAVITALANRHSHIFSDKHCHASLLDGIRLSRAKHHRYKHHNLGHLQQLLHSHPGKDRWIITEAVFSMEGSIADYNGLRQLAKSNHAKLIIDQAHTTFNQHLDTPPHSDILVTPLGKTIGSVGAMVSGNNDIIETILQFGNSYRYTTALPPAIAAATSKALDILQQETWRQQQLQTHIETVLQQCKQYHLPLINTDNTPIKCIYVGENALTIKLQQQLMQQGFFVAAIRPPTVENNKALLRISLNCDHTTEQITQLITLLHEAYHAN